MSLGHGNGFGYFHQPQNSLVAPLIVGGLINAALFWANAFHAVPNYLARGRWRDYLLVIVALYAANVGVQTVSQKLIILISEPGLSRLGWADLAVENMYLPPFALLLSTLYKFARDWVVHLRERHLFHARAYALEQALMRTRDDVRVLRNTNAHSHYLHVKTGTERLQIPIMAIRYVKSAGNYVEIVTSQRTYLAYGALKDFSRNLPGKRFVRIHRSYLVALEHIRTIRGDAVQLNDRELPIGAVYKRAFLHEWDQRTKPQT